MHRSNKKRLTQVMHRSRRIIQTKPQLASLLHEVCRNNFEAVKDLSQRHPSLVLEPIDDLGTTVLGVAVGKGFKKTVDYLLDKHSGHNLKQVCDKDFNGLLGTAIKNDHIEVAKRLLEIKDSGINVNQPNKTGCTPLDEAVKKPEYEIIPLLLERKATVNLDQLFVCCVRNDTGMASLLLPYAENKSEMINQRSEKYKQLFLLEFAITNVKVKAKFVELLINHGAMVNPLLDNRETLLIKAVEQQSVNKVRLLLNLNQIDINAQCEKDGLTALMLAANCGNPDIVELLLEKGADPNLESKNDNKTALMIAAGQGHKEIVVMLIANNKTKIEYLNKNFRNALYFAIRFWKPDIINLLLDVENTSLYTICPPQLFIPLFIQYYDPKTSKNDRLLIEKICKKYTGYQLIMDDLVLQSMEDKKINTWLDSYIRVQTLSRKAIQLDTIKPRGKPLLSYAVQGKYMEIFTTLSKYAHTVDQKDTSGRTPLSYAAASGSFIMFNELLKKHANLKAKDLSDRSILSYAIEGLHNKSDYIGSQCIMQKLLGHDGHNFSVAELTDTEYIQLLDFVLQNKEKVQWMPKLEIFNRCIKNIENTAHILNILDKLSQEEDKPYLTQIDQTGRTLLSHFAQTSQPELVKALINQYTNINVDQIDDIARTPLFYALENDHIQIIEILLNNRADVNHIDRKTYTPLLYAIERKRNMDVINMLLKHGANLSYSDEKGHGILCYAINSKCPTSVVYALLPKMIQEEKCHTELCVATYLAKDDQKLYTTLIDKIAPLFEEDNSEGWTNPKQPRKWNDIQVSYSEHACQRAKERDIKTNAINDLIKNFSVMKQLKKANHILKLIKDNICVVIAKQGAKITVITAYRINKGGAKRVLSRCVS